MKKIPHATKKWLLDSDVPRIRYSAQRLFIPEHLQSELLLEDELIGSLITSLNNWIDEVLKQHNKPDLCMHRLCLLADSGISTEFTPIRPVIETILASFDENNIPTINILLPKVFKGSGEVEKAWVLCDYPQILYSLLKMGVENKKTAQSLVFLESQVRDNGFPCCSSLPKFRGPGAKDDFCPIASLYALKALNQTKKTRCSEAAGHALESLLNHWENRGKQKHYLFGIGTDFKKLKYPMIWYNLLHVLDVVSESNYDPKDSRVREMGETLLEKADDNLCFTPESMYRYYKDEDFANKKQPSQTVTIISLEILKKLRLIGG
jgi:hypothetical protein